MLQGFAVCFVDPFFFFENGSTYRLFYWRDGIVFNFLLSQQFEYFIYGFPEGNNIHVDTIFVRRTALLMKDYLCIPSSFLRTKICHKFDAILAINCCQTGIGPTSNNHYNKK